MAIRIVSICGSVRPGNYSAKAMQLALDELASIPGVEVMPVYPETLDLPLPGMPAANPGAIEHFQKTVRDATGVLLVSPEYHGGISSPMKLAIDNLGFPSMLADKPVQLIGVAAGVIGAIKSTEQLRAICAHVGAIPLPMTVSVARVQQVFDEDGNCRDAEMDKFIRRAAHNLVDYIQDTICHKVSLEEVLRADSDS